MKEGTIRRNHSSNPRDWEQYYDGEWVPYVKAMPPKDPYRDLLAKYEKAVGVLKDVYRGTVHVKKLETTLRELGEL